MQKDTEVPCRPGEAGGGKLGYVHGQLVPDHADPLAINTCMSCPLAPE